MALQPRIESSRSRIWARYSSELRSHSSEEMTPKTVAVRVSRNWQVPSYPLLPDSEKISKKPRDILFASHLEKPPIVSMLHYFRNQNLLSCIGCGWRILRNSVGPLQTILPIVHTEECRTQLSIDAIHLTRPNVNERTDASVVQNHKSSNTL